MYFDRTLVHRIVVRKWFYMYIRCAVRLYMCMQVGPWEGMCYMQLSPGGWGYPGGMQMSQVLFIYMYYYYMT